MGDLRGFGLGWLTAVSTLFALLISGASAAPAYAQNPLWAISSSSSPTNFAPGDETGDDKYVLTVVDAGGASDAGSPIEVSDTLPTGITASAVSGEDLGNGHALACNLTPKPTCTYEGFEMAPGDVLRIEVTIKVNSGVSASVTNSVSVGGGGAATGAQAEDPTTISPSEADFGISSFATIWSEKQAGASVNLTAGLTFNQALSAGEATPAAEAREMSLNLPAGLIADPQAIPMCMDAELQANACPSDTAVGVAFMLTSSGVGGAPVQHSSLVYNTAPSPDHMGSLTLFWSSIRVSFEIGLRTDGTYGLQMSARDLPTRSLLSMSLTLWGAPASNDGAGPDRVTEGGAPSFGAAGSIQPARFLRSPTSCASSPPSTLSSDSWVAPNVSVEALSPTPTFTGCNRLPFEVSLSVTPDTTTGNAPAGYSVELAVPHQESAAGLARSDIERAAIALPEGTGISLSSANGLEACSEAEANLDSSGPVTCPGASTIGTIEVATPLFGLPLMGHIYLAIPEKNPSHSPLAMYVEAESPMNRVRIKMVGQIEFNPITDRWEVSFRDLPQLPIDDLALHFSGGPRALLSTPPTCGLATSTAELEPWSANAAATASSAFQIDSGAQGTQCSAPHPFSPAIVTAAGATSEANTFKSLALLVSRANHDEEQELGTIAIEAPPALAQMFAGVQTCEEPRASEGLCTSTSEVGRVESTVGLGSHPAALDGPIYLTGPYGGAAQSLSIVLPLDPGPFDFGAEVVRAAITVNPSTGSLILTSGQLPTLDDGIALHLDEILLLLDRGTFKVNPACESLGVTGTITSTEGSTVQTASNPVGASSPPCPHSEPAPLQGAPKLSLIASGASTVRVVGTDIATNGRGVAKVKLACKGTARCLGSVTLTGKLGSTGGKGHSKQDILGTADFSLKAGATTTIDVKLSARARSMLRFEHGSLRAVLSIWTSSPKPAQTHSVTVQLSTHKIRRYAKR